MSMGCKSQARTLATPTRASVCGGSLCFETTAAPSASASTTLRHFTYSDFHQFFNDIKNIILWTVVRDRPAVRLGTAGFSLAVRWRVLVNHHADGKNIFNRNDSFAFERCIVCNFAIFLSEDGPLLVQVRTNKGRSEGCHSRFASNFFHSKIIIKENY